MSLDVTALDEAVQARYRELAADAADAFERRTVPDFREYDGVRVEALKVELDPVTGDWREWIGENQTPVARDSTEARTFDELAELIARRAFAFEQAKLNGRGPAEVARIFLESHPVPRVYAVVPPHVAGQATEEERRRIKVRHVFGVGPVSAAAFTRCPARDVLEAVEGWSEWQVLVPGAMVGGTLEAPEFADTWLPVESVLPVEGHMHFAIAGTEGEWVVRLAEEVAVREGW